MYQAIKHAIFISILIILTFIANGPVMADSEDTPLAKSDFFTITQKEVSLLSQRMSGFFKTTPKEYCRGLIRIKLFSQQAREAGMDKKPEVVAELQQMIEQKLADIYINRVLDEYTLIPGTIESYYYSHSDEFVTESGDTIPLDDDLKEKIQAFIKKTKRSEIAGKEMQRLMEKYQVEIIDPVCAEKEDSNE